MADAQEKMGKVAKWRATWTSNPVKRNAEAQRGFNGYMCPNSYDHKLPAWVPEDGADLWPRDVVMQELLSPVSRALGRLVDESKQRAFLSRRRTH